MNLQAVCDYLNEDLRLHGVRHYQIDPGKLATAIECAAHAPPSPHVVQTWCKWCAQDVEAVPPYTEWRDRGNNTHCQPGRRKHRGVR